MVVLFVGGGAGCQWLGWLSVVVLLAVVISGCTARVK